MSSIKISSLLADGEEGLKALKEEFKYFSNGMNVKEFREAVTRHSPYARGKTIRNSWSQMRGSILGNVNRKSLQSLRSVRGGTISQNDQQSNYAPSQTDEFNVSPVITIDNEEKDVLGVVQESCHTSSLLSGISSYQKNFYSYQEEQEWINWNNFENLFNKIDSDSDGLISWDDVLQLAVEEATQSITIMTEEMRSYSFSRVSPRMKLIQDVFTLPNHKSLFAVVSRAEPFLLINKKDFTIAKKFSLHEIGNTHPQIIEYLPFPDVFLSYTALDKTIRGWWNVVSCNRMGTLNPIFLDDNIRRIRTHFNNLPYSFFTGGSQGNIIHWQVPKQRSVTEISQINTFNKLHPKEAGGITDFTLTDELLFTTGFDHRLLSTNIETGRTIIIGRPQETIRFLEYNKTYSCLPSVSYSHNLFLWDVRSSAITPPSPFRDDSARKHTSDVIGLSNARGLPQVITADTIGWVKVWDLRMLRCIQTLYADGSVGDELNVDFIYGEKLGYQDTESLATRGVHKGDTRCIRSLGYFNSTQEIVCSSSEAIYCVRYNHRRDVQTADVDAIQSISYDIRQGNIFLQGPTRTSVWDATEGFRKRVFDRAVHTTVPYWQQEVFAMCIDYPRSRVFFALTDGIVEVRSSKNFNLLETFSMHESKIQEMIFTSRHALLVSIALNGTLTVRRDIEPGSFTTTLSLSSQPLRALTISDEVGLIACCDERSIFMIDFKQPKLYPFVIGLNHPARIISMLGKYPIFAIGSDDGELTLWSTPPLEESHLILASLFIGRASSAGIKKNREKRGYISMRSTSLSRHTPVLTRNSMASETIIGNEDEITNEEVLPKLGEGKKTQSFEDLLHIIDKDNSINDGLSAITFDDVLHRLFIADQKGNLFIYSICSFLQKYGIQRCSFEKRKRYHLKEVQKNNENLYLPILLNTVSVHKGPANCTIWISALSAIISAGSDGLVKILDQDGKQTGELLMDRLPPNRLVEDVEELSRLEQNKENSSSSYSLPTPIPTSINCPNCLKISKELQSRQSLSPVKLVDEAIRLPSLTAMTKSNTNKRGAGGGSPGGGGGGGGGGVSWGEVRETTITQFGNYMSALSPNSTLNPNNKCTMQPLYNLSSPSSPDPIIAPPPPPHFSSFSSPLFSSNSNPPPITTTTTTTNNNNNNNNNNNIDRLVALEEKKKWRPHREAPRPFRERELEPSPSPSPLISLSLLSAGAHPERTRATSDGAAQLMQWWNTKDIPSTLATTASASRCASGLTLTKRKLKEESHKALIGLEVEGGGINTIASGTGNVREGLSLCGVGVSLSGATSSPRLTELEQVPLLVLPTQETRQERRGLAKKKKWKLNKDKYSVQNKEEESESFLDGVLRTYERELHKCIRGKNASGRLYKGTASSRSLLSPATERRHDTG